MSSVLQLALKHLDELSHGTRLGTVPLGHRLAVGLMGQSGQFEQAS